MQRLDRQRHAAGPRMGQHRRQPVAHHPARRTDVLGPLRQPADHQHQAVGPERRRLVHRPPVVVDRRPPPGFGRRRKEPAPAEPGDAQAVVAHQLHRRPEPHSRHLIPPRCNRGDPVPQAPLDRLGHPPLHPHRREVDRQTLHRFHPLSPGRQATVPPAFPVPAQKRMSTPPLAVPSVRQAGVATWKARHQRRAHTLLRRVLRNC